MTGMALRRLTGNILLFGVAGTFLWGQGDRDRPLSDLEYRYQKMEERALNLSKRLSAISGSDPIELIDRDQSLSRLPLSLLPSTPLIPCQARSIRWILCPPMRRTICLHRQQFIIRRLVGWCPPPNKIRAIIILCPLLVLPSPAV